jgi:glycerophosphoryl diester phosphodiesterase
MFDFQGHRGCRGVLPENTLAGFCKAMELGVTTLEMDTVISKDGQVVVSHEPYMNHEICSMPINTNQIAKEITKENEKHFNLYAMNYAEIQTFDCGLKPHPRFPHQEKQAAYKPLLSEVFEQTAKFAQKIARKNALFFNIETKCKVETDDIFHPKPAIFAHLLYEVIEKYAMVANTMIQSFDVRTLQYLHENDKKIALSLLVEPNEVTGEITKFEQKIEELGFIPQIYSPFYELVDEKLMEFARKHQMKVIPWTINEQKVLDKLKKLGIHGYITDYPNLVI